MAGGRGVIAVTGVEYVAAAVIVAVVVLVVLALALPVDDAEEETETENRRPPFISYAHGLVYASVCTSLTDDEATTRLNFERPTGVDSPWRISDDPTFADGTPHPAPCPSSPEHRHVLFTC